MPTDVRQALVAGSASRLCTAAEVAAFLTSAPEWRFAEDPARALGFAVDCAASAMTGGPAGENPPSPKGIRFWLAVADAVRLAAPSALPVGAVEASLRRGDGRIPF